MARAQAPPAFSKMDELQDTQNVNEEYIYEQSDSEDEDQDNFELIATEQGKGGVTYTRFGKASCPSGAQQVYKGVVAGSHYTHRGGGSNYLCLPENPEYSQTVRAGTQGHSYLYGTEYEHPLRAEVHDHNVPCAVCFKPSRTTTLMIPAKINCPAGFAREYYGFLMSAHIGHHRSEFVCVDKDQDVASGTKANTNGALMYHVEANCGSGIPCWPYRADRELTCVVCSR